MITGQRHNHLNSFSSQPHRIAAPFVFFFTPTHFPGWRSRWGCTGDHQSQTGPSKQPYLSFFISLHFYHPKHFSLHAVNLNWALNCDRTDCKVVWKCQRVSGIAVLHFQCSCLYPREKRVVIVGGASLDGGQELPWQSNRSSATTLSEQHFHPSQTAHLCANLWIFWCFKVVSMLANISIC